MLVGGDVLSNSNTMETIICIAGQLSSSLSKTVMATKKSLDELGNSSSSTQKKLQSILGMEARQRNLQKSSADLAKQIGRLNKAERDYYFSGQRNAKEQEKFRRKLDETRASYTKALEKVRQISRANRSYADSVRSTYGPLDKLIAQKDKLTKQTERYNKLLKEEEKYQHDVERRTLLMSNAQLRLNAARTIAHPMMSFVEQSMEGEDSRYRYTTLFNMPEAERQALADSAWNRSVELARQGYGSARELNDTQYNLVSGTLAPEMARDVVKTVSALAKVTNGEMPQVGSILTTAYLNLSRFIDGTDVEKFNRIADILAQTQISFKIDDFGVLGEGLKYANPTMAMYNMDLMQGVAAVGLMNNTGLGGSEAGTNLNAFLAPLFRGTKDYKANLKWLDNGQFDLVGTLRGIQKDIRGLTDEELAVFAGEQFGEAGARFFTLAIKNLDTFEKGITDLDALSKDVLNRNMPNYLNLTSTKVRAAKESVSLLAAEIGGVLAPYVTESATAAAGLAAKLGDFIEAHPGISKVVAGLAAAGVGLNLLASGIMYSASGFGALITAGAKTFRFLRLLRAAQMGVDVSGLKGGGNFIMGTIKGFRRASSIITAFVSGPQALLLAKIMLIALAVYAVYKAFMFVYENWDKICTWMSEKWQAFCNAFPNVSKAIEIALSPIILSFKWMYSWIEKAYNLWQKAKGLFGGSMPPQAAGDVVKTESGWEVPVYGEGGYVGKKTYALLAEKGPEMVVPLANRSLGLARLAQAASVLMPSAANENPLSGRISSIAGNNWAASHTQTVVNFSPTIILQGGGTDRNGVSSALKTAKEDLRRMLEEIQHENARTALA